MNLFLHKGRNIVVAKEAVPDDGVAMVSWVALSPTVAGTSKRGRRPNFSRPVSVKELAPLAVSDVSELVLADAEAAVSKMS